MLKLDQISFSYNSSKPVLDNISYTFSEDCIYGIVGANGAGKTTLFRLLLNQLNPLNGHICLNGIDCKEYKKYQRQFAFSPDEPQYLYYLSGMEWLLFVLSSYHKKADFKKLQELIDVFNFPEIEQKVCEYSHGMVKKLSMIINIMVDAYCLLFDESFAGIDPFVSNSIHDYVKSIKKNKIILISSHNKDLAENLFDKIIYLKNGIVKEINNFEEIFD